MAYIQLTKVQRILLCNCAPEEFDVTAYSSLELIACVGITEISNVLDGENYDFISIYGRLKSGLCEVLHDFDVGHKKYEVIKLAEQLAKLMDLKLVDFIKD